MQTHFWIRILAVCALGILIVGSLCILLYILIARMPRPKHEPIVIVPAFSNDCFNSKLDSFNAAKSSIDSSTGRDEHLDLESEFTESKPLLRILYYDYSSALKLSDQLFDHTAYSIEYLYIDKAYLDMEKIAKDVAVWCIVITHDGSQSINFFDNQAPTNYHLFMKRFASATERAFDVDASVLPSGIDVCIDASGRNASNFWHHDPNALATLVAADPVCAVLARQNRLHILGQKCASYKIHSRPNYGAIESSGARDQLPQLEAIEPVAATVTTVGTHEHPVVRIFSDLGDKFKRLFEVTIENYPFRVRQYAR
jgi:hypothetical protein